MKKYFTWILLLFIFNIPFSQTLPPQDETFNPLTLNEPALPLLDGTVVQEIISDIATPVSSNRIAGDSLKTIEKTGWKVQAFITNDFDLADSVYRQLLAAFPPEDVEKAFHSPNYKIRIGNCQTREEAERVLKRVEGLGFHEAWIVQTKIKSKERIISY